MAVSAREGPRPPPAVDTTSRFHIPFPSAKPARTGGGRCQAPAVGTGWGLAMPLRPPPGQPMAPAPTVRLHLGTLRALHGGTPRTWWDPPVPPGPPGGTATRATARERGWGLPRAPRAPLTRVTDARPAALKSLIAATATGRGPGAALGARLLLPSWPHRPPWARSLRCGAAVGYSSHSTALPAPFHAFRSPPSPAPCPALGRSAARSWLSSANPLILPPGGCGAGAVSSTRDAAWEAGGGRFSAQ